MSRYVENSDELSFRLYKTILERMYKIYELESSTDYITKSFISFKNSLWLSSQFAP